MNCPRCGEDCRCIDEPSPAIQSRLASAVEDHAADVLAPSAGDTSDAKVDSPPALESGRLPDVLDSAADATAWREELAARLNRYRARRKPRPPRYPSLRLQFDQAQNQGESHDALAHRRNANPHPSSEFQTIANQALALDGLAEVHSDTDAGASTASRPSLDESAYDPRPAHVSEKPAAYPGTKIIEFPRFSVATPPILRDELAEPVMDRPRILEVPELAPPPPALGGITIEAAEPATSERQPGIDFPLQDASLARRILAAAMDGLIIATASGLFGLIFWKVTSYRPPRLQILGSALAVPLALWASYQYLLLVYSASTPGLRLARLELTRFDDSRATRRLRRWRVLASYLSAFSLGMGYIWVFLDEHSLCWHDRITRTYFAPKKPGNTTQPGA
jgi:hypothetical protein